MSSPTPPEGKNHQGFFDFIMSHKIESLAYVIIILGILLSFFERFLGGIVVGAVFGVYFAMEIQEAYLQFKDFLIHEGIFRGFIIFAMAFALLIAAPGIVIGTILGGILRLSLSKNTK